MTASPTQEVAPADAPAPRGRLLAWLQDSSLPYVGSLVVTAMLAGYANYLSPLVFPDGFTIKGQSLAIVIPFVLFPVTLVLWLVYRGHRSRSVWVQWFLIAMSVAWLVHMAIARYHGDQHTHLVWLYVPILALLLFKAPSSDEAWAALILLGWLAVVILILTKVLESMGAIPVFHVDQGILDWEKGRYWLPLDGHFGFNGRWPGPFGFNSKTGFVSVFLILLGFAKWTRSSWVFIPVGVLGILATGGRGSLLSLLTGVAVLCVFAVSGPIARIPLWLRMSAGAAAVLLLGYVFLASPTSTTGRTGPGGIWTAFVAQWQSAPVFGVGQSGLSTAGGQVAISMEAHSLYIQELAKFGIVGFAVQYLAIGIGLVVLAIAAYRGLSGPLAIVAAFFMASVTEIFHDGWQEHSSYGFMVILSVLTAGAWLLERSSADAEQRSDGLALQPVE